MNEICVIAATVSVISAALSCSFYFAMQRLIRSHAFSIKKSAEDFFRLANEAMDEKMGLSGGQLSQGPILRE